MKKITGLLLFLSVLSTAFAEDMAPLAVSSTRSLGMGGTHVAYTDDVYALFVNPAALRRANQGSVLELSPATLGPVFDVLDMVNSSGKDLTSSLGDFAKKTGGKIPIGFDLRGPFSIGYTANGMGFGFWDRVHLDASIIGTDISASVLIDFILNYGMSFSILSTENHAVDAGFAVKPFVRAKADLEVTALDAIGGGLDDIMDEFNIPLIAGAGLDLGFMYRFRGNLSAGLTIDDVYTGGGRVSTLVGDEKGDSSYRVPTTLNLGAAYTLRPLPWMNLAFMLDYRDFTNLFFADDFTRKNPILNLAFGAEVSMLQIFKLRIGLNEMLPAAGIGFVLKAFQFNAAIYGKELSNEPGGFSTYALDLSIAIRPGTKAKTWPWSQPIVNTVMNRPAPDTSGEAEAAMEDGLRRMDAALAD
jgi:hypothetical protein